MTISSLFNAGTSIIQSATAGQVAVSKNIAGMNDTNYHKINTLFYAMPQGVRADFIRSYNQYTDRSFIKESSNEHRWTTANSLLQDIQPLFNESGEKNGIGKTLTAFLNAWSALGTDPTNTSAKMEVVSAANNLIQLLQNAHSQLQSKYNEINDKIIVQTNAVNGILEQIAEYNRAIQVGGSDTSFLLDQRDALVKELATYIDIDIVNASAEHFTITTKAGYTLINGDALYTLSLENGSVIHNKTANSQYTGELTFSGISSKEYTLEIVQDGAVGTATFRVSVDGGKTWLKNPNPITGAGAEEFLTSTEQTKIGDITVAFSQNGALSNEDSFTVLPHLSLFWERTSSSKVNITPQNTDGTINPQRANGGSLAGLFDSRDTSILQYMQSLETFTKSLITEVNKLYATAAQKPVTSFVGASVQLPLTTPMRDTASGIPFAETLTSGTMVFYMYNADGSIAPPPVEITIDPAQNSVEDLLNNIIDASRPSPAGAPRLNAYRDAQTGALVIEGVNGAPFALAEDSTGIAAALGMNNFFSGTGIQSITITDAIRTNPSLIATGTLNTDGSISVGKNDTAIAISQLQNTTITITSPLGQSQRTTLFKFYTDIASHVGGDIDTASFQETFYKAQAGFWYAKGQSEYGVNQDEELTFSMQLQNFYAAGTKVISAAQTMFDQLISIV